MFRKLRPIAYEQPAIYTLQTLVSESKKEWLEALHPFHADGVGFFLFFFLHDSPHTISPAKQLRKKDG